MSTGTSGRSGDTDPLDPGAPVAVNQGRLLRAWRLTKGLRQEEFGADCHYTKPMVSMCETGQRPMAPTALTALVRANPDALALDGMWRATGDPAVFEPRAKWLHNYTRPGLPVWVWLRTTTPGGTDAGLMWGEALRGLVHVPDSAGGVLVTIPVSIINPPLTVRFKDPGWASFGDGEVPIEMADRLAIHVVDGVQVLDPTLVASDSASDSDSEAPRELGVAFSSLRRWAVRLGLRWSLLAPQVVTIMRQPNVEALDGPDLHLTATPGGSDTDGGVLRAQLHLTPDQLRALRTSRGYSIESAAKAVTRLDPVNPITKYTITRLDSGKGVPRIDGLLSRLNTIYDADGRVGLDRVTVRTLRQGRRRSVHSVTFPEFWRGPVWVQVRSDDPHAKMQLHLQWGLWQRRCQLRSGVVVTTRKATTDAPPLLLDTPIRWRVGAGTGAPPTARDINERWWPTGLIAAATLFLEALSGVDAARSEYDARRGEHAAHR